MFRIVSNRLPPATSLLSRSTKCLVKESKSTYIKGYWPEPITQQTLNEFLKDINYFEEPKKFVNIGLKTNKPKLKDEINGKTSVVASNEDDAINDLESTLPDTNIGPINVDDVLDLLSDDAQLPEFNYDDAKLDNGQLVKLAIGSGIYRDLFGQYVPNRDHIKFTPKQAANLDRLVPHHWITDQPFARVERNPSEPEPLYYFEPVIGISARFINDSQDPSNNDCEQYAHTSYHGNIIPAAEALVKPSIALDGHKLSPGMEDSISESRFDNWTPGTISLANFKEISNNHYYSVVMLNLDSFHPNSANLHWMLANISPSENTAQKGLSYEEICDYLPVHGIRGFGYSRYVFLVLRHDSKLETSKLKISGFSHEARRFNTKTFIEQHKAINMLPVGLSWFQTTWDVSSNKIFHDYMNMRSPVYEHVQYKPEKLNMKNYPGKVPFNIFLDHYRDKKEINEQVLLERLKSVDPFDYKDQYVPPKVPPTVFKEENLPSWMNIVMFKKKNKVGYWRGLRPASATLPLDNNADLDYPLRPIESSKKQPPGFPNLYPAKIKYKQLKDLPYSKPANEHEAVYIQDDHEIHLDKVKEMMKEFKPVKKQERSD